MLSSTVSSIICAHHKSLFLLILPYLYSIRSAIVMPQLLTFIQHAFSRWCFTASRRFTTLNWRFSPTIPLRFRHTTIRLYSGELKKVPSKRNVDTPCDICRKLASRYYRLHSQPKIKNTKTGACILGIEYEWLRPIPNTAIHFGNFFLCQRLCIQKLKNSPYIFFVFPEYSNREQERVKLRDISTVNVKFSDKAFVKILNIELPRFLVETANLHRWCECIYDSTTSKEIVWSMELSLMYVHAYHALIFEQRRLGNKDPNESG